MAEARGLLRRLLIEPEEAPLALRLGLYAFLGVNAFVTARITAEALFLSHFGPESLVTALVAAAMVSVATGVLYGRLQGRFAAGTYEQAVLWLFAGLFAAGAVASTLAPDAAAVVLFLAANALAVVTSVQQWNTAGAFLTTRQAKRLFPAIGGAGAVGGIVCGAAAFWAAERLGTLAVMLLVPVALAGAALLLRAIHGRFAELRQIGAPKSPAKGAQRGMARTLAANRHARVIAAMTVLATLAHVFADYQFKVFSQQHFTVGGAVDTDALSAFYGAVESATSILAGVIQFALAGRIMERFGLTVALLVLPMAVVAGAGGVLAGIGGYFAASTVARSADKTLRFSLFGVGNQMLYMALPERLRKPGRALIHGALREGATIGGTVLLWLATVAAGLGPIEVGWVTLGAAAAWAAVAAIAGRSYIAALATSLDRQRLRFERGRVHIDDPAALADIGRMLEADQSAPLMRAIGLARRTSGGFDASLLRHLAHRRAEVRAAAAEALAERGAAAALLPLLDDPDPRVRGAAARGLAEAETEALRARGRAAVAALSADPDAAARREAAAGLRFLAPPERRQLALALARDGDPAVRRHALRALADGNDPEALAVIARRLGDGTDGDAAAHALAAAGEPALPALAAALTQPKAAVTAARALARIGTPAAARALANATANAPADRVRDLARAWSRTGGPPAVAPGEVGAWATRAVEARVVAANLGPGDAFATFLAERVGRAEADAALALLGCAEVPAIVTTAARALAEGGDPARRANALEVIAARLPRPHGRSVAAALDPRPPSAALPADWRARWSAGDDPWRRMAATHETEESTMIGDSLPMTEKLTVLGRTPLFSTLSLDDLWRLAEVAADAAFDPDEVVFEEGDPGDAFYVLVAGRVRVHQGDKVLNALDAGAVFGEVAVLDNAPRSATVTAETECLGLRIGADPFFDVLRERPAVAMAVIRVLTDRLRRLSDRAVAVDAG